MGTRSPRRWRIARIGSSRVPGRTLLAASSVRRRRRPVTGRHVRSISPDDVGTVWGRSWSPE